MSIRLGWKTTMAVVNLMALFFATAGAQQPRKESGTASPVLPSETASLVWRPFPVEPEPEHQSITVMVGKSVLVESPLPMDRVAVGLGDTAEVQAVGPTEVLLNGKLPGETSLIIWQEDGSKLLFDVTVQPAQYAARSRVDLIEREMETELPGQNVRLSVQGDTVFLRGKVKDMTSADRALSIASTLGKTVNLLYVDVPPAEAQILLKVKFASVDRSLSDQLGINLFSTGAANTIGSLGTQQFSPPAIASVQNGSQSATASISDALNVFLFRPDLNLGATIRALQSKGLLEILAEPNVLAQSGRQASFLAGGEFPFPVVQGSTGGGAGAVTIQFREFGVRLNFLPILTPRGSILLRVAPEVSALDFTHGLSVSGFSVPALTVRNLSTEVELEEGQSFAIGGLLDNRVTEMLEKVPFLGDLPVLGKFFQSKSRTKENTELLVIVTPELVRPMPKGMQRPALNFSVPFMEPNTRGPMNTPGLESTGPVSLRSPYEAIPIETLMKSLAQESPLNPAQSQSLLSPSPQSRPSASQGSNPAMSPPK